MTSDNLSTLGARASVVALIGTDLVLPEYSGLSKTMLTHWGRVTHICVSNLTVIGSDNGLSPERHQAINQTNAVILLIWPLGTNFSEILIEINIFSFKKMHLNMSSAKWCPFCLGLNVLNEGFLPPFEIWFCLHLAPTSVDKVSLEGVEKERRSFNILGPNVICHHGS